LHAQSTKNTHTSLDIRERYWRALFIARSKSRGPPDFKGPRATFMGRKRDAADSMEGQPSQHVKDPN
jgi:hypothetical protein